MPHKLLYYFLISSLALIDFVSSLLDCMLDMCVGKRVERAIAIRGYIVHILHWHNRNPKLHTVDLNEQVTGTDPSTGDRVTLNGNINVLFLWNNGEKSIDFNGDNSVAMNAILRK